MTRGKRELSLYLLGETPRAGPNLDQNYEIRLEDLYVRKQDIIQLRRLRYSESRHDIRKYYGTESIIYDCIQVSESIATSDPKAEDKRPGSAIRTAINPQPV
jgi:hypothetical protein